MILNVVHWQSSSTSGWSGLREIIIALMCCDGREPRKWRHFNELHCSSRSFNFPLISHLSEHVSGREWKTAVQKYSTSWKHCCGTYNNCFIFIEHFKWFGKSNFFQTEWVVAPNNNLSIREILMYFTNAISIFWSSVRDCERQVLNLQRQLKTYVRHDLKVINPWLAVKG